MPLILNIETATDICSVCVSRGIEVMDLQESESPYTHASTINILIDQCLKEVGCSMQDLDAVALSRGPGSYTALRVGAATAKGICYALNKPLIAVDTLRALALATARAVGMEALYCPMIDARRMEVYTAVFDRQGEALSDARSLIVEKSSFDSYRDGGQQIVLSGNGAAKCLEILGPENIYYHDTVCSAAQLPPLACQLFREGTFSDIAYFSPFYLKPPNITRSKKIL